MDAKVQALLEGKDFAMGARCAFCSCEVTFKNAAMLKWAGFWTLACVACSDAVKGLLGW